MTPPSWTAAAVRRSPSFKRSRIHGLDTRVSCPSISAPPRISPIAWPMAATAAAFSGNSPARARMPSVPNSFVFIIARFSLRPSQNLAEVITTQAQCVTWARSGLRREQAGFASPGRADPGRSGPLFAGSIPVFRKCRPESSIHSPAIERGSPVLLP